MEISKLDHVDRKLLHMLDTDARMPISQIARKARVSRIVAEYRINKMQQAGLIRAFASMMDPCKFGFSSWKVYLRFHNLTPKIEKNIISYLQGNRNVWWAVKCYGRFDFLYSVFAESFYEFNEVLEKFHELFGQYVLEESINNHLEPQYFSRGYLLGSPAKELCEPFMKKPSKEKIDNTDIKIMIELGKDCRRPLTQIAQKTNTTAKVVAYRIKELQKRKIVVFNRLNLDVNKLGMDFYKGLIFMKNASKKEQLSFVEFCRQNPYINEVVKSVGEWQMEIELEVNGFKHFNQIMEELRNSFPDYVIRTEPLLLQTEYKSEFNFLEYLLSK